MDRALKVLYGKPLHAAEDGRIEASCGSKSDIAARQATVAERKIVLRIVDDLNMMATDFSLDSFICGFKLLCQMANKLNNTLTGVQRRRSKPG
ncbi:conserved protein of unknown function [Ruminococcaceae bacterium BL-6]|jgi:hypothetical protein|uniref:hypothetical protein n=1 Tax=Caproiciproducens sp. CPB-2 TaxID=3030017 RepID=UPI0015984D16|nr:hypothetical protein [Caproiciproducens sp. CPB-2]MDF1494155.1 hypothetical protein [Caproiciproducens sp. CPB-2]CAB1249426.1 conserved protein of unknown function [Ruminococcaceae bacterium BL-6]